MSKIVFSRTTGLIEFFGIIQATNLDICESKKTGNSYVVFKCADDKEEITMLAKSIKAITPENAGELQVSWIEGTTEEGNELSGYMVHPTGERKVVGSFSLADLVAAKGMK
jgi:hypothetical protein